jgi:hypothetical protein
MRRVVVFLAGRISTDFSPISWYYHAVAINANRVRAYCELREGRVGKKNHILLPCDYRLQYIHGLFGEQRNDPTTGGCHAIAATNEGAAENI